MLKNTRKSINETVGALLNKKLAILPALTLLIASAMAPIALATVQSPAGDAHTCAIKPDTFYVSRRSSVIAPSLRDGQRWSSAWADFDEVKWDKLPDNAKLYVDAGGTTMLYSKGLKIPGNKSVSILQSTDSLHKGIVEINGTKSTEPDGIAINGPAAVNIGTPSADGTLSQTPFIIRGFNRAGIRVGPTAGNVTVFGTLIGHNGNDQSTAGFGVLIQGGKKVQVNQSMIRNSAINVHIASAADGGEYTFDRDWIYWTAYNPAVSQGLRIAEAPGGKVSLTASVVGPGLDFALLNDSAAAIKVSHCLFNNAQNTTFQLNDRPASLDVDHVTTFMTPKNRVGGGAFSLRSIDRLDGTTKVTNSVIYDGSVAIPAEGVTYAKNTNNFQFRVDGMKTFYAATQRDPLFANAGISSVPNAAAIVNLIKLDFSFASNSPAKAAGAGSALTSAGQLKPPAL